MITLRDVVLTAQDGRIDRLKVGMLLALLTKEAIAENYITTNGAITASGAQWLSQQ